MCVFVCGKALVKERCRVRPLKLALFRLQTLSVLLTSTKDAIVTDCNVILSVYNASESAHASALIRRQSGECESLFA